MGFMRWVREMLSRGSARNADSPGFEFFIYIKIPESIGPIERGEKYEDRLESALVSNGLGEVSGGGSQLGEKRPDGTRPIEFCGIDVDVADLDRGLPVLREELRQLGAPVGTELHYTVGDSGLQDELHENGWVLRRPRTSLHAGFGN